MDKMTRVLQVSVGGSEFTGVASFLLQYYKGIDHSRVHFDFLFCKQNSMKMIMDQPLFAGSEFIVLGATRKNSQEMDYLLLIKRLSAVLREKQYDVVHINTTAVGTALFCLITARLCGVKTVISHSHNAKVTVVKSAKKRKALLQKGVDLFKSICPWLIRTLSHALFACSEPAGVTLFGEKGVRMDKFHIIRNAIVAADYRFSPEVRMAIRSEYDTDDKALVVGHVGRMAPEKNHLFLIDVFREIHETHADAQLWLIGSGPEKEEIERKIRAEQLEDCVKLLGQKNDVHHYLQAIDVFVFPSVSEGLGMVAIEAQAAGLPTYASDTIPLDTRVTDLIRYLPLGASAGDWARQILEEKAFNTQRRNTYEEIAQKGYDVTRTAEWLENYYVSRSTE